jgi:hypothetical protein
MKVLIVEDDAIQAGRLEGLIQSNFRGVGVDKIDTELKFRESFGSMREKEYRVALIDMMLRWTDPSPNMEPPPDDVVKEGFYVGGLRCRKLLLEKKIPSVIFTVLNETSIPQGEGIEFIQKGPSYQPVLDSLRKYL